MLIPKAYSGFERLGIDLKTKIADSGNVSGDRRFTSAFDGGGRSGNFKKRDVRTYSETYFARLGFITRVGVELTRAKTNGRECDCNGKKLGEAPVTALPAPTAVVS